MIITLCTYTTAIIKDPPRQTLSRIPRRTFRSGLTAIYISFTSDPFTSISNPFYYTSPQMKDALTVVIRPLQVQDCAAAAQIWRDGLEQSAASINILLRPCFAHYMAAYGDEAMSETGDVGVNGSNLPVFWNGTDRVMLCAFLSENPDTCVGVVGVKIGPSFKDEEPGATEASIWRMSVDGTVRRRGIGLKLMEAAQQWAKEHGCTSMGLWTVNKIAASFYCDKCGFAEVPNQCSWYAANIKLTPNVLRYTKELA